LTRSSIGNIYWSPIYLPEQRKLFLVPVYTQMENPRVLAYAHIGNRFRLVRDMPLPIDGTPGSVVDPLTRGEVAAYRLRNGAQEDSREVAALMTLYLRGRQTPQVGNYWQADSLRRTLTFLTSQGYEDSFSTQIHCVSSETGELLDRIDRGKHIVDAFAFSP